MRRTYGSPVAWRLRRAFGGGGGSTTTKADIPPELKPLISQTGQLVQAVQDSLAGLIPSAGQWMPQQIPGLDPYQQTLMDTLSNQMGQTGGTGLMTDSFNVMKAMENMYAPGGSFQTGLGTSIGNALGRNLLSGEVAPADNTITNSTLNAVSDILGKNFNSYVQPSAAVAGGAQGAGMTSGVGAGAGAPTGGLGDMLAGWGGQQTGGQFTPTFGAPGAYTSGVGQAQQTPNPFANTSNLSDLLKQFLGGQQTPQGQQQTGNSGAWAGYNYSGPSVNGVPVNQDPTTQAVLKAGGPGLANLMYMMKNLYPGTGAPATAQTNLLYTDPDAAIRAAVNNPYNNTQQKIAQLQAGHASPESVDKAMGWKPGTAQGYLK
jgi:hypothetical protein